jgi:hypothetical protein
MDSDDELPVFSGRPDKKRPSEGGGILSELSSPPQRRARDAFTWSDGDDVFSHSSYQASRNSPFDTTNVRPVTAFGQGSDIRPVTAFGHGSHFGGDSSFSSFIPDLDEDSKEAVKAPLMTHKNLSSYQDLQARDLSKHASFASFDGIDMSPLFSRLLPESEVVEKDTPWTWDNLIPVVSEQTDKREKDDNL